MEQKANVPASETSSDSNYKFALIGTVVWFLLAFAVWLTCMIAPAHPPIKLSEHGDYLAGVAAPVAFFWLVLGYRQQSRELRQNTDALRQQEIALRFQGDELRKSVKQQIKMNKTTRLQLESDRKDRDIATAQRTLPSYQKCLKYYKSIRRPHHLYAEYIHRCEPKDLIDRLTGFADAYQQGIIQEMEE
jgi:hypothetical protein